MIEIKRVKEEKIFHDNWITINTELTYHYDTKEEFKKHLEEMEKDDYKLELSTEINVGGSEEDVFKIAAYYTKHETIGKELH